VAFDATFCVGFPLTLQEPGVGRPVADTEFVAIWIQWAMENPVQLTHRFTEAVDYARRVHVELRKGTQVPYMAHLLGVASLVLGETGHIGPHIVTEDLVIAALLHDAVEDEGGLPRLRDIEEKFGKEVAKIVEGCSDSFEQDPNKKQVWEVRKAAYIERLWNEPPATLLVSVDKLYNARAILVEYRQIGAEVWTRFKRGPEHQLRYFDELIKIFEQRCSGWRIVEELKRTVKELAQLSAEDGRSESP
jgi:(p)ppGpp synthase/HD superfamily hydrolase